MPVSVSVDLRKRVVEAYLAGEGSYEVIASRFRVGPASVSRWLSLHRKTGDVLPRPHGGGSRPKLDSHGLQLLAEAVRQQPDITLAELGALYAEQRETRVARCTICRALQKLGLVRKKR